MPRHVSFSTTPTPCRNPNFRTSSKVTFATPSKTPKLHRTLYDYVTAEKLTDTTLDQSVPAEKIIAMSYLDKEEEVRMAKSHKENTKKGVTGAINWLEAKIKSGGMRKS